MTPEAPTLTNKEIASLLGLSESGVSRLRTGARMPSLDVMQRIEKAFQWSVQRQSNARAIGSLVWTDEFEAALSAHAEANDEDATD